jgi:hypothetical protein
VVTVVMMMVMVVTMVMVTVVMMMVTMVHFACNGRIQPSLCTCQDHHPIFLGR